MPLVKKPEMTKKKLAAQQRNARKSRGAKTTEGKERVRDVNLRHGFYSQDRDTALQVLGEDPEDFNALVKATMQKWPPADGFEERLVMRLARAMWRMERGDRMKEGYALRQAQEANSRREDHLHAQMMRLRITEGSLQALADAVAQERYVTTAADLELINSLHAEGVMRELGEIAVGLCRLLQAPATPAPDEPGEDEDEVGNGDEGTREDQLKKALKVVTELRAMFGFKPYTQEELAARGLPTALMGQPQAGGTPADGAGYGVSGQGGQQDAGDTESGVAPDLSPADADPACADRLKAGAPQPEDAPNPYPNFTPEEWEARERLRRLLANILRRQVELCQAQRVANLRECVQGPSPYERAAEIAPAHPNARLMQRMDDASFREVWRIINMLLKIQGQGGRARKSRKRRESHDVHDNKTT